MGRMKDLLIRQIRENPETQTQVPPRIAKFVGPIILDGRVEGTPPHFPQRGAKGIDRPPRDESECGSSP